MIYEVFHTAEFKKDCVTLKTNKKALLALNEVIALLVNLEYLGESHGDHHLIHVIMHNVIARCLNLHDDIL